MTNTQLLIQAQRELIRYLLKYAGTSKRIESYLKQIDEIEKKILQEETIKE